MMVVRGVKAESREKGIAKGNDTKREREIETTAKSLDEEKRKQRGGRW